MSIKVIKDSGRRWRQYRFPPLSRALLDVPQGVAGDPAALQRAISEGYDKGLEQGFAEGAEQGREAGHDEGYRAGFAEGAEQGREQGRAEGRHEFDGVAEVLDRAVQQLDEVRRGFSEERRAEMLELVRKVSTQVIRMELTLHPDQLLTLAEEALAGMPGDQEDVRIHLNPEECARIKDMAPEAAQRWRLVPDESLALGECRVLTAHAEADVGCQQRLNSCMEALTEHMTEE